MTLDDVAGQLYALAPEDFVAARDAAAKQAKVDGETELAKQVKALRKPSVGAWLVNLLATEEPDLLEELLSLGPALAEAQAQGQGDQLRQLGAQRRDLVGAVTARAVELSERTATAALRDEVSGTLEAALVDAPSADAVRSGRLVRALSYAGFGGVDLEGAVGGPVGRPQQRQQERQQADEVDEVDDGIAVAEAAALEAAGRLDDRVRECERLERERQAAEGLAASAHEQVERLQQQLHDAQEAAAEADRQRKAAERASEKAVDAVRKAQRTAEQARADLDRLRRG